MEEDSKFLRMYRRTLSRLGAFGFESWYYSLSPLSNSFDPRNPTIFVMSFIDSPETIVSRKGVCAVGDGNLCHLLQDLGFHKQQEAFTLVGSMAQLGDFRLSDGIDASEELTAKVGGVVLKLECLPIGLLSTH
jgi:hypothetical protein